MARTLADYGTFFREFRRNFHTTGSILPSSRYLATALAKPVKNRAEGDIGPRKILEVGPGSGAVTEKILAALGPDDRLDLVEINEDFVTLLRRRLAEEPAWQAVADRVQVKHQRMEELLGEQPYDVIISGLPLNNFSVVAVDQILKTLAQLVRPGGQLSFFEYIYIRNLRAMVSKSDDRIRLRGITKLLNDLFQHEQRRDSIWLNFPPAWVHHIVYPAQSEAT